MRTHPNHGFKLPRRRCSEAQVSTNIMTKKTMDKNDCRSSATAKRKICKGGQHPYQPWFSSSRRIMASSLEPPRSGEPF
ncbi:hypothetical protein E2C01_101514 [Portunus trituberculatus]|uniref:Uncharacterized protein n=1 Tax=Portunus trituberculatus TaxID=210409 RepID=A0A5B7K9T4_PORTR|nr:hypothetical protein [Portunus trituberculatus]